LTEAFLETEIVCVANHFNNDVNVDGRPYICDSRVRDKQSGRSATGEYHFLCELT
jgi:hypothetical protein